MIAEKKSFDRTPHILVIDDTPEDVRSLLQLLRAQPWRLSVAHDARQGYQRALVLRPDLIVLDVRMPYMDGFTLCRLLREEPATQRVPVIFLTSAVSLDERIEGLSLGGVDYVSKPFAAEEVLARIRVHLQLVWRDDVAAVASEGRDAQDADQVVLHAAMRFIGQNLN